MTSRQGWRMAALAVLLVVVARADEDLSIWRDPAFRGAFLGSYGMRAEVEPRVSTVEAKQMEAVADMMAGKNGLERTRAYLERTIKPASSAVFDFTLANIYFQQEALEPAARAYEAAIEKFPSFLRAHRNLGIVYVREGEYDEAVKPLTRAVELGATDGLGYGLLGYSCMMTERYVSAESAYRLAMMLQPDTVDWRLGLARCLFRQHKFAEAASLCGELIAKDPERADYWLLQANAYLGMKAATKAAENYEYLDLTGKATSQSLNALGDIYVNDKLPDLAADAYARAMDKDDGANAGRYLRDAEVLAARAAYADARWLLERIRKVFGERLTSEDRKRGLKLDARLAAAGGAAAAEQIKLLEEIVSLDPLDGEALILLAQQYAGAGKLEKAIFYFERAAGLEKYEAEAVLRQGQCLVRAGRFQEALPLLKRAQDLRPRDDVAKYVEQVERVARLRM